MFICLQSSATEDWGVIWGYLIIILLSNKNTTKWYMEIVDPLDPPSPPLNLKTK